VHVLIDCDVLLDVVLARQPFCADSAAVLAWAVDHPGRAAVAWHTLANLAYLTSGRTRDFLCDVLRHTEVAPVGTAQARQALALPMADLEDALQAAAALAFRAQYIVTRNLRDYRNSPVPALSPRQFVDAAVRRS
jgi:hypothetical protein